MIIDFQHHYTPAEMLSARSDGTVSARTDANGNPNYLVNPQLADLDAHIRMMDGAGIDAAVLSSGHGFDNPDAAECRRLNDRIREAEEKYPGRFIGLAHVPALDGKAATEELTRCRRELNFPGVVIGSELQGKALDTPELDPFWKACSDLGLYVFVHPLPAVINWDRMDADDLGRAIGWEFSLMVATIRMMNGGVLDRFPDLKVQFAHYSGGIGRYLGRLKGFVQRGKWGTSEIPRHNREPARDYDYYLNQRLMYDCAGWAGPDHAAEWGLDWIRFGAMEVATSQVVFATDYPQAVRDDNEVKEYVAAFNALEIADEVHANAIKLIPDLDSRV